MSKEPTQSPTLLRWLANLPLWLIIIYWWGAFFFDEPYGGHARINSIASVIWLILFAMGMYRLRHWWQRAALTGIFVLIVAIPWLNIDASNDLDWSEGFEETGHVTIDGDTFTFHNFRNYDYTDAGESIPRWTTRTVQLSKLQGLDIFHDRFLGNFMAHPMLSFDFGEQGHICLSIETRREKGEYFNPLAGLYKKYELQYIFSDEKDVVRLRTNVRNEPVYLYKSTANQAMVEYLFLSSVEVQNKLATDPEFYNILNANCTTSIRNQIPEEQRSVFDIRILINGLLDQLLYEEGSIVTDNLSFEELRERCFINDVAQKNHKAENFSAIIRNGRPGQITNNE
ncbi:DUF4105 domain-containing protein [Rubritalea marina]|uniref:lipoprotein N-acyltransferase Lnb domain-containing protein n=1 Tax=Rubritalea marina TaxID=361055 RepID=UPI000377A2E7|nr:DUF4105 domain-containing protein [Rubritalea marina]